MAVQLIRKVRGRQPTQLVSLSSEFAAKKPIAAFLPGLSNREIVRGVEFISNNGPTKNYTRGLKTLVSATDVAGYQGIKAPESASGSRSAIFYEPAAPPLTIITVGTANQNNGNVIARGVGSGVPAFACGAWYGSFSGGTGIVRTTGGSIQLAPNSFNIDVRYVPVVTVLSIGPSTTRLWCGVVGGDVFQEGSDTTPAGNFYYEYGDDYRLLSVGGCYSGYATNTALAAMFGAEFSAGIAKSLIANPWQIFEPETIPLFFSTAPSGSTLKAWNGSSWVLGDLKRWNGSIWEDAALKRWDGAVWVSA